MIQLSLNVILHVIRDELSSDYDDIYKQYITNLSKIVDLATATSLSDEVKINAFLEIANLPSFARKF